MLTTLLLAALAMLPGAATPVGKADRPAVPPWAEIAADARPTTILTAPEKSAWLLIDDGADLVPASDGKSATFAAPAKGRYRVLVVPPAGEPMRVVVVVGDAPAPTPPKPPGPVPPEPTPTPTPVDPLVGKFAAAFAADTRDAAAKKKDLDALVKLYAKVAAAPDSPATTTVGELVAVFKKLALEFAVLGLAELRKLVAAELASVFTTDAPLDDAGRAKAKALFLRLSAALAAVK